MASVICPSRPRPSNARERLSRHRDCTQTCATACCRQIGDPGARARELRRWNEHRHPTGAHDDLHPIFRTCVLRGGGNVHCTWQRRCIRASNRRTVWQQRQRARNQWKQHHRNRHHKRSDSPTGRDATRNRTRTRTRNDSANPSGEYVPRTGSTSHQDKNGNVVKDKSTGGSPQGRERPPTAPPNTPATHP